MHGKSSFGASYPPTFNAMKFADFSAKDIPADYESFLEKTCQSFFGSSGYALLACDLPAERVSILLDEANRPNVAWWYRESYIGTHKRIYIYGQMPASHKDIRQFVKWKGAACARIHPCFDYRKTFNYGFPWYRCVIRQPEHEDNDFVIDIPDSQTNYLSSLGSQTRKHLPYYLRRVQREWGANFSITNQKHSAIKYDTLKALVELNKLRINNKGDEHLWSEQIIKNRLSLARECGMLHGLFFRNQLVAGTLSYCYENEAYLYLIGHAPEYDRLNLGNLCLWLTINNLIEDRIRRYHLMWGKGKYKLQFGGIEHPIYEVLVFRNLWIAIVYQVGQLKRPFSWWVSVAKWPLRVFRHLIKKMISNPSIV